MLPALRWRLAVIAALLAAPTPLGAQEAGVRAVLDLTVNTARQGEIVVLLSEGDVWADVAALERAGLTRLGGERRALGDRLLVKLSSIEPRPVVVVDEAALTLAITADPLLFRPTVLQLTSGRPDGIVYRRAASAFLNYGASWTGGGARALNLESGVSLGRSLVTSSFFLSSLGRPSRGMTTLLLDDPARMTRLAAGDTIVATGPLGGSLQIAGVSVSRDFSLDPYFVRYPTTGLSGLVTTPSRVDVYVNDQLLRSVQVQPGAYELANLALPTGATDTRIVVRDAFGGEQEFGGSYYVTTSVLARGLQQFQYAAGVERLRPFDSLWAYGRPVVTGTHRVGLTDGLTLGGRIEAESGLLSAGPTLTARVGRFGAIELGAAASRTRSGGLAASLAYEYVGGPGGLSVAWREASEGYETLTSRRSRLAPRREVLVSATTRVWSRMTVGAGWQARDLRGPDKDALRRANVSSTITLGRRLSLFLSATRTRAASSWSTGGYAALGLGFGSRGMATASTEMVGGAARAAIDVQHSAPVGQGFGYRVRAAGLGEQAGLVDGELRAQTRFLQADLRQSVIGGRRETWAQVNGSLVAIGGRVLAARPVQDGFALVRVPEVAGVRAYVSHQEMGRTDRRGDLLVPNLVPYYGNQIAIADADVPVDRTLTHRQMLLAPPYRGGAIAEFPATREQRLAGSVTIVGQGPLGGARALDATLTIDTPAGPLETWLGTDGDFYVEGLGPGRYRARVISGDLRCSLTLDVPASDQPVARLGAVACHVDAEGR